jgi:hypothetical protein
MSLSFRYVQRLSTSVRSAPSIHRRLFVAIHLHQCTVFFKSYVLHTNVVATVFFKLYVVLKLWLVLSIATKFWGMGQHHVFG